jgi:hypothetical protein
MQSNGNDLFEKLLGPVSPMAGVGMGARNGMAPPPTASVSFADGLMGNENDSAACANSGKGRGAMGGFGAQQQQQQQQQQQLRPARAPFGERVRAARVCVFVFVCGGRRTCLCFCGVAPPT